jgi:hypothetical protein
MLTPLSRRRTTKLPSRPVLCALSFCLAVPVVMLTGPKPALSRTLQSGVSANQYAAGGGQISTCGNPYGCANRTYTTGTQTSQPNDAPCANPYGCGRGGLSGGYSGNSGVYCQQTPGMPQYGPYSGTGTQRPCGPNFGTQQ